MTKKEFIAEKNRLQKLIIDAMDKVMKHEITADDYFVIHKQWTDLMNKEKGCT